MGCLLLALSPALQAQQSYASIFGQQSTEWTVEWGNLFGFTHSVFFVEKDTIVNGLSYKKIISEPWVPFAGALMREDTLQGKVWYKGLVALSQVNNPRDTAELLAFDYSLMPGDSFDVSCNHLNTSPGSTRMEVVDSVRYINGRKHIYFGVTVFGRYSEKLVFIEGETANVGPNWKYWYNLLGQYLLCVHKDGQKTDYVNQSQNGQCVLNYSTIQEQSAATPISLAPNPFWQSLQLEGNWQQFERVQVFTLLGRLVYENTLNDNILDLSQLPKGSYLLQLSNSEELYSKIIIKN